MTKPVQDIRLAVAVVEREGAYLVTQRLETSIFPGLWEFPGGRIRDGESLEDALRRTLNARLSLSPDVGEVISSKRHAYAEYEVTLTMVQCDIDSQSPEAKAVQNFKWVPVAALDELDWVPADLASMKRLVQELD